MLATGTNVYLYALDLGEEPSSGGGGSGEIKLLPSIVEYTDSSGVDVSFSNPLTYNLTQSEQVAKGQFKYIYIIADSTYNYLTIRELQCFVDGTNVALSSGGASAVWTKTDINTTTTSAHNIGASTKANDGTILKNETDNNIYVTYLPDEEMTIVPDTDTELEPDLIRRTKERAGNVKENKQAQ